MCFSETASYTAAAALVPAGIWCLRTARGLDRRWLPLAAFPLAFGIQQGIEGLVWRGLDGGDPTLTRVAAVGFLFFSHLFWPAFVPYAAWRLEPQAGRARLLGWLAAAGATLGLFLYLPTLAYSEELAVAAREGSIVYNVRLPFGLFEGRAPLYAAYAMIVVCSLALSSEPRVRHFAALIAASLIAAAVLRAHALVSVWCFFAAIASLHLARALTLERRDVEQEA